MLVRTSAFIAVAVACGACAQERPSVLGYQGVRTAEAASIESAVEASQAGRKSLAAKVLAAIALERVTGRKPDPARLVELN